MTNIVNVKFGVARPPNKEMQLRASQIKRLPARRLAEALLVQFPDIEIGVEDGGYSAFAMLHGTPITLCEVYNDKRDGREGWYTLTDRSFPQLVAFFNAVIANHQAKQRAAASNNDNDNDNDNDNKD